MEQSWREILDFERASHLLEVPKARAIRSRFGFSPLRYQQFLNRAIDDPSAFRYDPITVSRLRRLRQQRSRGWK